MDRTPPASDIPFLLAPPVNRDALDRDTFTALQDTVTSADTMHLLERTLIAYRAAYLATCDQLAETRQQLADARRLLWNQAR